MNGSTKTVFTGDIVWSDGTTSRFPPILRAHSGWWYRPDEAIYDKRKTFGMGDNGRKAAMSWHGERLRKVLLNHHNEHPVKIGNPLQDHWGISKENSALVWYDHPVYGRVCMYVTVRGGSKYGLTRNPTITYGIQYHRYLLRFSQAWGSKLADEPWADPRYSTTQNYEVEASQVEATLQAWKRDPWITTFHRTKLLNTVADELSPPAHLTEPDWSGRFTTEEVDHDGVTTYLGPETRLWSGVEVRKIIQADIKSFEKVANALKYFGVDVRLSTTYGDDYSKRIVNGMIVEIPADRKKGNEEGHKFVITADGIEVSCGYAQEQEKYNRYEIRKAKKLITGGDFDAIFEDFNYERNE